ncbi:MAG: hypothetical protein U1C97_01340, partial [Candidatus Gracilibacteria bacterium]|nr:hypothetical protein [Candidatus Gracilibacteria bacterium]
MATQEKPKQTPEYTALKIDVPTLSETQVQTIQLIEELKKKATTPETMKKAVEELKKLDTKNHEGLKKLAEQAIGEFEKRLETPEWQDKLYANKEIILAGAAIIAIGAWFFRDKISSSAKWGLTAVSAAAAGYIGYQYWNEQEFLKQHQGKGEKGKDEQEEPGKLPDQPKQGLEAESSDTLAAFETHESLEKTCRESYLAAVTLANKIDRGQKAWAKEDISTFTLAIDKLNELKKSTSTESVKERCDERIAFLLQYYAAPGTPPETWWDCFVASAPGTAERVLSSLFGGEIFWVSLGLGAVVYAERSRKLGVSLMKAVKEGYTGSIADAVGSKFFGAEKYSRLKVASELMDIEKAGGIRLADDLLTAGKVLKEGGTPLHEAARLAETPAFRQRWWHLRRSLSEQQQAARTYQHAVMEGAQGYRAQLDELAETMKQLNINSVEDAEKFLTKLETPRSVWHASTWTRGKETARMVKIWKGIRTFENALSAEGKALFKAFAAKQGREALLALGRQNAEHADDLVKILSDLEPVKLQPKMWDKFLKGCKKQLATCADDATRQVMVATLKQSAKETLPRQSRLLGRLTAVGVAVEFAVVLFYQYEANEIEEMVSKMEKVEDPKRIAVLNERIWTKRYAQSGVSLGMGLFMAWKGVTIPGALPLVALQLLYESLGNTASEAAERRTRSPQAWATERSRENLIKLVCMEHGVSDGDWIGKNLSWIPGIEYAPDGVTLLNNKELRKYYFTALLLQSWGVEKMEEGKSLMDEIYDTNTLEEKKSEAAQMIRQELDFIESAKPEFDPKSPIEVNHLLTQARLVALIKKDKAQLSREVEELKKLASPDEAVQKTSEFYRAFQEYADEEDPLEVEHETLVSEFQKEYFQQATEFNLNQYSALDKTGHARAEGIQKLIERNHKEPKEFLELASAEEQENYAGLISAFPLSGSLFEAPGSEKKEQVEATSTRHALESRMDEMYTLLALEQQFAGQPVRGLAPEVSAAFNDCFAFCFRYYEAVYGVPYQPVILMDKLDEERVHEWVRSLSKERSQGIVFGKDEAGLVQYAISDSEIELNFNASQQQETQGLYSFARAVGYRGPMEKALIQQYFSPDKALDQGIYFDGKEWKIVNIGIFGDMAPDFTFSKWVVDELIRGNILVRKEGYDAPILEAPASPTQR